MKIQLGQEVVDVITGFSGIATAEVHYLNGCIQYCITPRTINDEGKPTKGEYFDQGQIEVLGDGVSDSVQNIETPTGGPQRDCPKH